MANINSKSIVAPLLATDYLPIVRGGLMVRLLASQMMFKNASGYFEVGSSRLGIGTSSPTGQLHIAGTSPTLYLEETDEPADEKRWRFLVANGDFRMQRISDDNLTAQNLWVVNGGTGLTTTQQYWSVGSSIIFKITAAGMEPGADNSFALGGGSAGWSSAYFWTSPTILSDERHKRWLGEITPAHIAAAQEIAATLGLYQLMPSIESKGEGGARHHFGVRAQQVMRIFMAHGLEDEQDLDLPVDRFIPADARPSFLHAFLCFDTWPEQSEPARAAGNKFSLREGEFHAFLIAALAAGERDMAARMQEMLRRLAALEDAMAPLPD